LGGLVLQKLHKSVGEDKDLQPEAITPGAFHAYQKMEFFKIRYGEKADVSGIKEKIKKLVTEAKELKETYGYDFSNSELRRKLTAKQKEIKDYESQKVVLNQIGYPKDR